MTDTALPSPPRKRRWPRRLLLWSVPVLLALLIGAWLLLPAIARPIIRAKLQAMISDNLNAHLNLGPLSYAFPYGIDVGDSSLLAHDETGQPIELIHLPQSHLELAKLPFGKGPLVIKNITLRDPAIHLVRNAAGLVGQRDLLRPQSRPGERRARLSEMFELRLVGIEHAQILYEDRTQTGVVPLVWRNIDIHLTTQPETNPLYAYQFTAASAPLADLHAAGIFNIDTLDLDIARLKMIAQLQPGQAESPAPPIIQQLLTANAIGGTLSIGGTAHLPLTNHPASTYDFRLQLADAQAHPAGWDRGLDSLSMKLRLASSPSDDAQRLLATAANLISPTTAPARPVLYATVQDVHARSGPNTVKLARGDAMLDWLAGRWTLPGLEARIHLATDADLPAPLRAAAEKASLVGNIALSVRGEGSIYLASDGLPPFQLNFHAASPKLLITDRQLELTHLTTDLRLDPTGIQLIDDGAMRHGLLANAYAGRINATGQLAFAPPNRFNINLNIANIDLSRLVPALAKPGEVPPKISGRASLRTTASGALTGSPQSILDTLVASGDAEIVRGDFLQLPGLAQISAAVGSKNAARVGQAAAVFSIANRKIQVTRAAASAPVLGVVGSGQADFDGNLDFHLTAAPIADWKKQVKDSRIPILSDIGAELAGAAEKFVSSASRNLLAFHITGTLRRPIVKSEAAPAVTQGAKNLFGEMLKGSDRLLDHIRREDRK